MTTIPGHDSHSLVEIDRFATKSDFPVPESSSMESKCTDEFLRIIQSCDLAALKYHLTLYPCDANAHDKTQTSALMYAVSIRRHSDQVVMVCEELLKHGADVARTDSDGYTVCHWAAACGEIRVLRLILDNAPELVRLRSLTGETPLHRACRLGRVENIDALLTFDITLGDELNNSFESPLDVCGILSESREDPKLRSVCRLVFVKHHARFQTLVLHHPDTLMHATRTSGSQGTFPWEAPERVIGILAALSKSLSNDVLVSFSSEFTGATDADILRCHSSDYLDLLKSLEHTLLEDDPDLELRTCIPFTPAVQRRIARLPSDFMKSESLSDTSYSSGTLRAAKSAAGSVIHAIKQLFNSHRVIRNVFCVVRPPGHHVGYSGPIMDKTCTSCGFSILNSVAIGALYAVRENKKRVAIVDLDVHHGNGTEDIVRRINRPSDILFVSIHQADETYPGRFYPGTGFRSDYMHNVYNFPLEPTWAGQGISSRERLIQTVTEKVVPLIASFRPDIILMSTGFDGAAGDVGNCLHEHGKASVPGSDLTPRDYAEITRAIMRIANVVCDGRIVSVLEGGYGKMTWTTSTVVTKSIEPDNKRPRKMTGNSDDSTKASSDDWGISDSNFTSSSGSPTTANRRKRLNREIVHSQVLNRQLLTQCAMHHVRALASL